MKNTEIAKKALWNSMLLILFIVAALLFACEVPQDIQRGINGQVALKELDGMSHPLLNIKAATSAHKAADSISMAKSELERLGEKAESHIHRYESASAYSSIASKNAENFVTAYNMWIASEKAYLNQLDQERLRISSIDNQNDLSMLEAENDSLFLSAMQHLADGKEPIHDDIANGRSATQVLQWTGLLIVIYFFTVIVLFQRSSNRDHVIREKNLEVTLKSIGEAVIATDVQGCVTSMNPEAERLTGWTLANAKSKPLTEVFKVVDGRSGAPVTDLVERVKREKTIVVLAEDSMLIASNGDRYQIYENGAPIYDDTGNIIGVVLVFRDITHAHNLKNRLNVNAKRLQRVVDSSMDAVIVVDEQGMVEEWNPAAELMFGWSFEEIRKKPIHESIIPEEFREQHLQGIRALVEDQKSQSIQGKRIESLGLHRDGHLFPIELAMTSIRTEKGWVFNAFIRDLTDSKKNEDIIKKHHVLLRETQRVAKLGYWELDLKQDSLEWSDEIYRIFCLDPEDSPPSYELFISTVHPDDRKRVDTAYNDSLKYKIPYNIIHRIITKEGEKIVLEQCETTYDNDGNPTRSLGLVQDITERVSNLDELRLAATMFKTHAAIMITEKDGTIVRVNPAFEKMTGYSSNEIVGKNPRILQSGKQSNEFYNKMWNQLSNTGMWQGELWNKRKDGMLYAEWLTITAVNDEFGGVKNYVGTSQDITVRKEAESKIEYLAYHDDLTDLANRRLLLDRLHQSIVSCKQHEEFGAVLLLDLDHFKDLNDSLGHSVGNDVLRQVASRLQGMVREDETVARLSGDEFVVVLPSVGSDISTVGVKAQSIAEKIRLRLSQAYQQKDGQCFSNVSIGISLFPENSDDADNVLKCADIALHKAKSQGRNTVCFYHPSMQVAVDERLAIADGLRNAARNNEFMLHYQPQFNDKGKLIGAEALIRWEDPVRGTIPPDKFISVAEDTGMILEIGQWILHEASRQIAEWHTAGICKQDMMRFSINVSPRQFHQKDFVEQVLEVFKQADISPDCIDLEITESLLVGDLEEVAGKMEALRKHGIRISIDDFGTGYSSLSYLKQLPLDQLKIDQSFVRDISSNANDAVVVETIIAMARHLGLSVIAEGVEDRKQLDFLMDNGCRAFQGYYFSRPLNADDFACYITESSELKLPKAAR